MRFQLWIGKRFSTTWHDAGKLALDFKPNLSVSELLMLAVSYALANVRAFRRFVEKNR